MPKSPFLCGRNQDLALRIFGFGPHNQPAEKRLESAQGCQIGS
jgi:hypothetical protein